MILSFEDSLRRIFVEVLTLEGYPTEVMHTAAEARRACDSAKTCVALIDNYHVSQEAQVFAKMLFSHPDLHAHVKLIGLAAMRWENLVDLDAFVRLPFTVDKFLDPIARLTAELQPRE